MAVTVALLLASALSAAPPPPVGGQLPLRCRASAGGRTLLELNRPAPRPYPLGLPGRSLSLALALEKGVLSMEVLDDEKLVDRGGWRGSRPLARVRGRLSGTALELRLDEPPLELSCAAARP